MTQNKVVRNAMWIVGCRIVQALLSLVVTVITARYLGPSGYGTISYAASLVAFVVPVMQLGLNNVLVREFVDHPEEEGQILGTSIAMNLVSSLACIVGVVSFAAIANAGSTTTIIVCALYSILLLFQAFEMTHYWFQFKYLSKYTALVSVIAYAVISGYKIFLLATGKSVYWFAVSNALDHLLISVATFCIYKKLGGSRLVFSLSIAKRMFSQSRHYIVSSLMVTIFAQTDRIMLTLMESEASTGYYSAAVSCTSIASFLFAAIIDSARPAIFESKNQNEEKFAKQTVLLYSIIIYLALFQSLAIALLSKPLVHILYGTSFYPAVPALRVITWYTMFSYLGGVRNIWMLAEKKQKYLWIINLSGALLNVVMNAVLIPIWGVVGAAVASLLTQIFTNVVIGFIIKPIRPNNRLMIAALNPVFLIAGMKQLLKKKGA